MYTAFGFSKKDSQAKLLSCVIKNTFQISRQMFVCWPNTMAHTAQNNINCGIYTENIPKPVHHIYAVIKNHQTNRKKFWFFGCIFCFMWAPLQMLLTGATVPVWVSVSVSEPAYGAESRSNQILYGFYFSTTSYISSPYSTYYTYST